MHWQVAHSYLRTEVWHRRTQTPFTDTLATTWIAQMFSRPFTLTCRRAACGMSAAMCWTMTSITIACCLCTSTFWILPRWGSGSIPETSILYFRPQERWIGSHVLVGQWWRNGSLGQVTGVPRHQFNTMRILFPCTLIVYFVCLRILISQYNISLWQATGWLRGGIWPNDLRHRARSGSSCARGASLACSWPHFYLSEWRELGRLKSCWWP